MAKSTKPRAEELGPSPLHPRNSNEFFGHSGAEEVLLQAYSSGRLPHAWMLTGPRGIGKATLAYRFARFLMNENPDGGGGGLFGENIAPTSLVVSAENPVSRRVAAGSHGDLVTLELSPDDKGKMRSNIPVEDVRKIVNFTHKTSIEGGWRVVIVDAVEEMNNSAANALLKVLEEPPEKTVLLLISHLPGQILQTIHSRCCHLPLTVLDEKQVVALLQEKAPEVSDADALQLARLAEGSVGKALDLWQSGGLDFYREMIELLGTLPRLDIARLYAFADKLSVADPLAFKTGMELFLWWLARLIKLAGKGKVAEMVLPGEGKLVASLIERHGLAQWLGLWEKCSTNYARATRANLDKKQVVVTTFMELQSRLS
ncbi:DNA polymerase III subunit delta' [Kiloniella laminariae]|uniref:DNA polymerase III subunit delta' n=1 Tax=Kiloniella laminariae TaxID=454162 RepID=UPI00035FD935|nr:DNA polymerase III subunit delta' [Kiloniella laminariae]